MSQSDQYVYGLHAVEALLQREAESVTGLWLDNKRRDKRVQQVENLARQAGVTIKRVSKESLTDMAGTDRHQGVVAASREMAAGNERDLQQLLQGLDTPPFLLVLDGVTDPHNLGACLRTADAAGIHAVITPRDKSCGLTATVRKVACGAAESVPFIQVTNLARTLRELQKAGVWIIGTALQEESRSLFDTDLSGPVALVLGAEGRGLRRLTAEHCDLLVMLPMLGKVQSLNVSVTTGICLYEALRQRTPEKTD